MPDDAGGIISSDEIDRLADLFSRFEGATDPTSVACKEAEQEFDSLVALLYTQKVAPKYQTITLPKFRSYVRNYCRKRIAKQGPSYPCIMPESAMGDGPVEGDDP
jgi:hypothetical protein